MNNDQMIRIMRDSARPDPRRKDSFIREHRKTDTDHSSLFGLCLLQTEYISSFLWVASAILLLLLSTVLFVCIPAESVWLISALTPFMSCIGIAQLYRSGFHGMRELEMVTKVSSAGIIFSRIVCIGTVHLCLLSVLSLVGSLLGGLDFLATGITITSTYLLTSVVCLVLERVIPSRIRVYAFLIVSVIISGLVLIMQRSTGLAYAEHKQIWILAFFVLVILEIWELWKLIDKESHYAFES